MKAGERVQTLVLRAVRTETPSPAERIIRGVAALASLVYGGLVRARNAGYNMGLRGARRLPCRVVCVGNVTAGGTGKTPTVAALATAAAAAGLRVCVLLRGYHREGGGVRVVSDGRAVQCDWREAGDEAVLLAERLPGVPVVVGGDRVETGKLAVTRFRPDLILLDDGFQHRRLYRDADLVLLDATDPFGGGRLLPWGRLREPITGLRRAHACLVTRVDQGGNLETLCRQVARAAPGRPIGRAIFRPLWLRDLAAGRERPVKDLCGKRVLAVSGIANPHSFLRTVQDLGVVVVGELAFRDHHAFDAEDRRRMAETARQQGAEWIVTTEKDAVRLRTDLPKGYPVLAVVVGLEIVEGVEALEAALGVPVRGVARG